MRWEIESKYTVVSVSSMMAMTNKSQIKVKEVLESGEPVFVYKGKRKRKVFVEKNRPGMLIFKGWDLPLKIDFEAEPEQDGVFSSKIIVGNACYNFLGNKEFVREYIEKNNINEEFNQHDHVLAHGERVGRDGDTGEPVYPEVPTTSAPVITVREAKK
tara:strand:+ start:311 stop:784 length:474 start_codon:yes stop_codon:yes gene_type:complete